MVNEAGRPLHPDSITARFNRLVDRAGVKHKRLHDVRHTYATLALDMGVDPKTLSDRIGHANMSVTLQIYAHPSHGRDQERWHRSSATSSSPLPTLARPKQPV